MENKLYYEAYEDRYRKAYAAGAVRWGHGPDDEALRVLLERWVDTYGLAGKRVLEFACGEGASGVILSQLGCVYHGVDLAPSALERAREALAGCPNATVSRLDMVREAMEGPYDAALDVMGLHMLITDADRAAYLRNACGCLAPGAPMLFYRESYGAEAWEGTVDSVEQWKQIHNLDLDTPEARTAQGPSGDVEVWVPLLAARPRSREGYLAELTAAGFTMDWFELETVNEQIVRGASFCARKP